MVENGCFFYVCIAWELAVHAAMGEVTDDSMGVAVDARGYSSLSFPSARFYFLVVPLGLGGVVFLLYS